MTMAHLENVAKLNEKLALAEAAVDKVRLEISNALAILVAEEEKASFGPINGLYYSVRKRGGRNYLCDRPEEKGPFGNWVKGRAKGSTNKKKVVETAPVATEEVGTDSITVTTEATAAE